MGLEPPSLVGSSHVENHRKGQVAGVDPGFSKGGANGIAWLHGCGKGEGAMEAFAMCA